MQNCVFAARLIIPPEADNYSVVFNVSSANIKDVVQEKGLFHEDKIIVPFTKNTLHQAVQSFAQPDAKFCTA